MKFCSSFKRATTTEFYMVKLTNPHGILFAGRCIQTATISIASNRWRSYGVVQRLSQAYVAEFFQSPPPDLGDKICRSRVLT